MSLDINKRGVIEKERNMWKRKLQWLNQQHTLTKAKVFSYLYIADHGICFVVL